MSLFRKLMRDLGMPNVEHRDKQMRLNQVYKNYDDCYQEYMREYFSRV